MPNILHGKKNSFKQNEIQHLKIAFPRITYEIKSKLEVSFWNPKLENTNDLNHQCTSIPSLQNDIFICLYHMLSYNFDIFKRISSYDMHIKTIWLHEKKSLKTTNSWGQIQSLKFGKIKSRKKIIHMHTRKA